MATNIYGEGSTFFDNGKNMWTWVKNYEVNGQKVTKRIRAKTKPQLKIKRDKFLMQLQEGKYESSEITVKSWVEQWLEVYIKQSVRESTYNIYKDKTSMVVQALGNRKLKSIKPLELQLLFTNLFNQGGVDHQGLSATSVNAVRRYFNQACLRAVKNKLIRDNPVEGTLPLKQDYKDIVVIDEQQVRNLLAIAKEGKYVYNGISDERLLNHNVGTDYYIKSFFNLVNLGFATGMRIGELRGLSWSDISFTQSTVSIKQQVTELPKKGRQISDVKTKGSIRVISVNKQVMSELRIFKAYQTKYAKELGSEFTNENNLVFTNLVGKPFNASNFRKRYFKKLLSEANVPSGFTIHCMRHTHATLLLKNKVNVEVVSKRLGHSSIIVTMNVYAHVLKGMEQTAPDMWDTILNGTTTEE